MIKLLLLATIASGQTTPEQIKDKATSVVAEYLSLEIRKNRAKTDSIISDIRGEPNNFAGVSTFTNTVAFKSSVTFEGGVFGNLYNSSFTVVTDGTTAQTSGVICYSTVTLNLRDAPLFVELAGSGAHNTNGGVINASVLVDGAYPTGTYLTNSVPIIQMRSASSTEDVNISFRRHIPSQGAGSTAVCLVLWTQTGIADWSRSNLTFGVHQ